MWIRTKGSRGHPFAACSPLFFISRKGERIMLVQGEKQLMMKVMWEALKKVIRRVLRRP